MDYKKHEGEDPQLQPLRNRYQTLLHGLQQAVAEEVSDPRLQPFRIGLNTCMSDNQGLAQLLINKGVITEVEYLQAIADELEQLVHAYEQQVLKRTGRRVRYGAQVQTTVTETMPAKSEKADG